MKNFVMILLGIMLTFGGQAAVAAGNVAAAMVPINGLLLFDDAPDTLLLHATSAGTDRLGALYEIDLDDLDSRRVVQDLLGGHQHGLTLNETANAKYGGLAYNPVDDRFYGILTGGGFDAQGIVFSFDPNTDELDYILELSGESAFGGERPAAFSHAPVISADGKSMMALASVGGRDPLPCDNYSSAGVLVHVDIDAQSPSFGKATPVLEMYAYSEAGGAGTEVARLDSHPTLGKVPGGGPGIFFLSAGVKWDNSPGCPTDEVDGRPLMVEPSNAQDWSEPWDFVDSFPNDNVTADPIEMRYTRHTIWSSDQDEGFVFARTEKYNSGNPPEAIEETRVYGTGGKLSETFTQDQNCLEFATAVTTIAGLHVTCQGTSQRVPTILGLDSNWANPTLERSFPEWTSRQLVPLGVTQVDVAGRIAYHAGDSPVSAAARIEWVTPTGAFPRDTLVTGDATIGKIFLGRPAVGGSIDEVIPARWVVFLSYDGGSNGLGALVKYDRHNGTISHVSLGRGGPTFPGGRPERVSASDFWVPTRFAESDTDSGWGFAVLDTRDESLSGVRLTGRLGQHSWWVREFVRSPDTAALWSVSPTSSAAATIVQQHDPTTGDTAVPASFNVDTGTSWSDRFPAYRPAIGDGKLWFVAPGPSEGEVRELVCADEAAGTNSDFRHWSQSFDAIGGPIYISAQDEFYIPATDGKIYSWPSPAGTCVDVGNILTPSEAVTGITDLPTTPMVLGSDGFAYFGTEAGKLARFDAAGSTVTDVADLADQGAAASTVQGFVEEVVSGTWVAIVNDTDGNGGSIARRIVRVDVGSTPVVTEADISDLLTGYEPYPGAVLY